MRIITLIITALVFLSSPVFADDPYTPTAYRKDQSGDSAQKAGEAGKKFYFRAGVLHMVTDLQSGPLTLYNVGSVASLAVNNGPIAGSGAKVDPITALDVMLGMYLPWGNGNWSVETILAAPLTITFKNKGYLVNHSVAEYALGDIPTGVPPLGNKLGETKALPPVVTGVYHFGKHKTFDPYLGAGATYMFTYDSRVTNPILTAVNSPDVEISNEFGYVLQAGMDVRIQKKWYVRADIKYIGGITATTTVKNIYVETPGLPSYGYARVGDAKYTATITPWIYNLGVGFNF